jgi:hypothetical protein
MAPTVSVALFENPENASLGSNTPVMSSATMISIDVSSMEIHCVTYSVVLTIRIAMRMSWEGGRGSESVVGMVVFSRGRNKKALGGAAECC